MQTGGTLIEKVQRCVRTTICIMGIRFIIIKVSIFSYLDFKHLDLDLDFKILAWGQLKICSY